MATKVSAEDLRKLTYDQLLTELEAFNTMYMNARQEKISQSLDSTNTKILRKNIARCTQILHEKKMEAYINEFKGKKHIPKELRPKLNRALRRRLTKEQQKKRVRKVRLHAAKYPQKIFSFVE